MDTTHEAARELCSAAEAHRGSPIVCSSADHAQIMGNGPIDDKITDQALLHADVDPVRHMRLDYKIQKTYEPH